MSEWLTRLLKFWELGVLPLLLWWSLICAFIVAAIEFEHRIVDRKCVEQRASLWRMAAILSLFFPLLIWLSPIALQVSIPSLRLVNNQLIHSWQAHPIETNEIPDGAGLHVFDRGFNPSEITFADIEWTLPGWPSLRPVADLSLPSSWTVVLLLIYGAGLLVLVCVQGYRKQRVRQFVWETAPCKSDELVGLIEEKARAFDIKRKIDVRVYDGAISPCIVGGRRIVFVLPRSMTDSWNREELTPILIHELSHVRHGDLWYEWAVLKLKALLWFNLFVYWLAYRLDDTREALADAHAVSHCGSAKEYAQLLVRLAESVIHYPGIQAAHPFAVPGKKTLRRLDRLKNDADKGRSFADLGYLVRIGVWAFFLFVIGGIHTAAPLVNMFSIVEPHPDTSMEALAYLREYRDWMNQYESGYSLSAKVSQRFSASDTKTEKSILLMTREARIHEWKNGSDFFRKDIFGTHELFPSLFEKDRNHLIWMAFSYIDRDGIQVKKYARDSFAPKRWIDADKNLIDPFQQETPNEADWIVTRAHKDNRNKDINFHNALVYCYYHNAPYITEMVECGERIATLERDGSSEIVTVSPTFGAGYKYVYTITPQFKPLPSRIDAWDDGRLTQRKELWYSDKKELLKLTNTTNSTWKTDTSNQIAFNIERLEAKAPTDSSLFETPELTQAKAPSVAFPADEALCYLNSPRTFDRETWAPVHPLNLSQEAFVEGYFIDGLVRDAFPMDGYSRSKNGKTIEGNIFALNERPGNISFYRRGNRFFGNVETKCYTLKGRFDLSGNLKKNPICSKRIYECTFELERPGFEPYLNRTRDSREISSAAISCEEYYTISDELFQQFGFIRQKGTGHFFSQTNVEGRLGETPKAELMLYNFGDRDVVIQSFDADPLVQVELPPDRIIPARSRASVFFQAPAGMEWRNYPVTLKLDHPIVKRLDVSVNVWGKT